MCRFVVFDSNRPFIAPWASDVCWSPSMLYSVSSTFLFCLMRITGPGMLGAPFGPA